MFRVRDVDAETHAFLPGRAWFCHTVDGGGGQVVMGTDDGSIFRPVLIIGDGVVQHHQSFAFIEPGQEIGFGLRRNALMQVVKDQHIPLFGGLRLEQGVRIGMLRRLVSNVGVILEQFEEGLPFEIMSTGYHEHADLGGGGL